MRFLPFLIFCLLSLSTFSVAQEGSIDARRTAEVIDRLYESIDSEMAAYLYEPSMVLCFGQKTPATGRYSYKLSGNPDLKKLNLIADSIGARFVADDKTFGVESKEALGLCTSRSKLSWVSPFDPSGDWESFEAWMVAVRDKLRLLESEASTLELGTFLEGHPDSAILSKRKYRSNPTLRRVVVSSDFDYGDFLEGENPNFDVLSDLAKAEDCLLRHQECSGFLSEFYNLPQVRARLNDPDFLKRRSQIHPSRFAPKTEQWLRGEIEYGAFDLGNSYRVSLLSERVLLEHADELIQMLEGRSHTGPEIAKKMLSWGLESEPPVVVEVNGIESWIWSGGYGHGTVRDRVYESVKKTHPEMLQNIAKRKVSQWLERTPKKEDPVDILSLFSHSGTKEHFATLDQAAKDKILERMENAAFDRDVRILLGQPPYAL